MYVIIVLLDSVFIAMLCIINSTADKTPKMPMEGTQNEVQIQSSVYTIRKNSTFDLSYNDSTCEDIPANQQFAICWRSCGIPKLIDCDLGPENILTSNPNHSFYILQNNGLVFSYTWLAFIFTEEFPIKAVKIHYICVSTDDTELNVNIQYRESNKFTDFNTSSTNIKCQSSIYRNMLMIGIPVNDPNRVIPPGDRIGIGLNLHSHITLYVSEVQFFKEGNVTDRGKKY